MTIRHDKGRYMKLTKGEVLYLIDAYIGTMNGSVGFPYQLDESGFAAFYPTYCDIHDLKPLEMKGTIINRFAQILCEASPRNQAKIIRGIFKLWFPKNIKRDLLEREEIQRNYLHRAESLEAMPLPDTETFSDADSVINSIEDAKLLMKERGAQRAIDRIHTALHAHLRKLCTDAAIMLTGSEAITTLFKYLREQHPSFIKNGVEQDEIKKILNALASIIDVLGPLRNHWSPAHPNPLLQEAEALLAIDAAFAVMKYLSIVVKS
jgi:hypothetical protein